MSFVREAMLPVKVIDKNLVTKYVQNYMESNSLEDKTNTFLELDEISYTHDTIYSGQGVVLLYFTRRFKEDDSIDCIDEDFTPSQAFKELCAYLVKVLDVRYVGVPTYYYPK